MKKNIIAVTIFVFAVPSMAENFSDQERNCLSDAISMGSLVLSYSSGLPKPLALRSIELNFDDVIAQAPKSMNTALLLKKNEYIQFLEKTYRGPKAPTAAAALYGSQVAATTVFNTCISSKE